MAKVPTRGPNDALMELMAEDAEREGVEERPPPPRLTEEPPRPEPPRLQIDEQLLAAFDAYDFNRVERSGEAET